MLLRKSDKEGFEPAEKNLDEVLNQENCFGIYRLVKAEDPEYQQAYIQEKIENYEIKPGECVQIPLVTFQNSFLKFPRITDAPNSMNAKINTKLKQINKTNKFPGRCFGGHVDNNLYYFHGSFQKFICELEKLGYSFS
jgi:hypothetical protein